MTTEKVVVSACSVHSIEFCGYDHIYKIVWKINGRLTNNFSTRGKRIGMNISPKQKALELAEAYKRADIVIDYLSGKINRFKAIEALQELEFLCPKNPTAHLATMLEYAVGLR